MAEENRITEDDIREASRRVTEERTREPMFNLGNDINQDELEEHVYEEEELEAEISDRDRRDVFADVVRPRIESGDFVKVVIYRDGELVATKKGNEISSWEDLHKSDIGNKGGVFKIQVKDERGIFRGQQTKNLGRHLESENENKSSNDLGTITSYLSEISRQNDAKFDRMFDKMEQGKMNESNQQTQLLTALIGTLAQPKEDKSGESNMMFMKMMMEMQNKSDDKMMTLFEKMNDKFERIVDKISEKPKDDDGLKWPEVMQMIESAKSGAKEETQYMHELIEKKAELIAAEKSENNADESITDKALKALLPALPALIQAGKGGAAPVAPAAPTAHLANNPQRRRAVRRKPTQERRVVPNEAQALKSQESETLRRDATQSREVSREEPVTPVKKASHGLPTVSFEDEIEVIEPEFSEISESVKMEDEPIEEVNFELSEEQLQALNTRMLDLCIPHVLSYIMEGGGSDDCATACINDLETNEIPLSLVEKLFSAEQLIAIADEQGLLQIAEANGQREEAVEWLRNFYDSIVQKAAF